MANNHSYFEENESNKKKVYINPNFQRQAPQMGSMYINPLFSHHINASVQKENKPKVFVNPNFVKQSVAHYHPARHPVTRTNEQLNEESYQYLMPSTSSSTESSVVPNTYPAKQSVTKTNELNKSSYQCLVPSTSSSTKLSVVTNTDIKPPALKDVVTKSRYSLVRQNNISNPNGIQPTTQPNQIPNVVTTYKINKYKSVSIESLKNNMENVKNVKQTTKVSMAPQITDVKRRNVSSRIFQSTFKLIKTNTNTTPLRTDIKLLPLKRRLSLNSSKTKLKISHRAKLKLDEGKFKKNNIPCPQFRKYGTCLRLIQGNCVFLHDRKHVTICRKFVRGICHDKNCLLSHELTAEKMPTCAFYLKGMCTKEGCPYLHVKLNEKAKICPDFLKGYCDKGNTCLNRHLNICPDLASKGVCHRKSCPYPHNSNKKLKIIKKAKISAKLVEKGDKKLKDARGDKQKQENKESGGRYYKVADSGGPEIETIKPMRCKLGALPSYIQL